MHKIGIDIGGTKIKGVLLDDKNQQIAGFNIETPKNKELFLKVLKEEIKNLVQYEKVAGIGVCLPGVVDIKKGILVKAPNISFLDGWQAVRFFSVFNKNIKIDNDSKCFLIAESKMGIAKKYKDIVAMTVGTGIGGAIMIKGEIYRGDSYGAGEVGHMVVDGGKTLEQLGAKKAFLRLGDRSKIVGIGVANLINLLNPEAVVLGGGGISKGGVRIEVVKQSVKRYVMSPLAKNTPILKGKLGGEAQAIGATMLLD